MSLQETQKDKLEESIREAFSEAGLVADWCLIVDVVGEDEEALYHLTSSNAVGWKAHGMALYLAAAHAPAPGWVKDDE